MKKITSILLVICIVSAIAVPASASTAWSGTDFTTGALAEKLDNVLYEGISKNISSPLPKLGGTYPSGKSYMLSFENRSWSGSQCMAYAYAAFYELFGRDPAPSQNIIFDQFTGRSSLSYDDLKKAGIRCGAYVRTTGNKDATYSSWNGHSFLVLGYDKCNITILEGVPKSNSTYITRIVKYTYKDFNRAILSGRNRVICNIVQPPDETYKQLQCVHSYKTLQKTEGYTAVCRHCQYEFKFERFDTSVKGTYIVTSMAAGLGATAYRDSYIMCVSKGAILEVVGGVKNAYGSEFLKTAGGLWIYAGHVSRLK